MTYYTILENEEKSLYFWHALNYDSVSRVAFVKDCRNILLCGEHREITSLACKGIYGPDSCRVLVGLPCPQATLTGIVNTFDCTDESADSFMKHINEYG
jgi:hypothetical protein